MSQILEEIADEVMKQESSEPQITLVMLNNLKNLIDVAIKRGAYQPTELTKVGQIYDEFVSVFNYLVERSNQ